METLICSHCPKSCGTYVETSIGLNDCASFGNSGGALVCDAPANAAGIPTGSYSGSCGGCSLDAAQSLLTCTHCNDGTGTHVQSSIAVNSCVGGQVIGNANGVLACEDPNANADANGRRRLADEVPNEKGIPAGSYISSCGGCKINEQGLLECSHCNTGGGTAENGYVDSMPSTISIDACKEDENIGNQQGTLTCEPLSGAEVEEDSADLQAATEDESPDSIANDGQSDNHEEL